MKIALVSPYDFSVPGGVNNHIAYLADNFRSLGNDVRIIAPCAQSYVPDRSDLIVIGEHPISIPAGGSVARLTLSLRIKSRVQRVLAEENFDIVHMHEPFMPVLPIHFLRLSDAVNIATFHATKDGGNRFYAYGSPLIKRWLRRLDGRIAVSPAASRMVSRYFPGHYEIIPNGVNVAHFAEAKPLPEYRDGKLNILFVGRPEKRKGLGYLLRAYRKLKPEMPNTRLLVVGPDGRKRRHYERYVEKSELDDVVFAGRVSQELLPRYYHTADVFCAPNTGNEGQGIILLEAMAAGRPIVASNIDGFASVLTPGVEALVVRPKDVDALAIALVRLLADADLRAEMGERGRSKAEQYSWEKVSQQVLSFYERVRNNKHAGRPSPIDLASA